MRSINLLDPHLCKLSSKVFASVLDGIASPFLDFSIVLPVSRIGRGDFQSSEAAYITIPGAVGSASFKVGV